MFKVIIIALAAVCALVYADIIAEGNCGDGIAWKLDTNGHSIGADLIVVGSGKMTAACNLTDDQKDDVQSVVIGDSVKTIAEKAFFNYRHLTSLTLGESLEVIGDGAFFLDDPVFFPWHFDLTIPNSVKTIGKRAFYGQTIKSLTLGESLEVIGDEAFSSGDYYGSLTSLTIPNSVKTIGKRAFFGQDIESLTLGESLEVIGDEAFFYSDYYSGKLTSLTIPKSVKTIGKSAFAGRQSLESLTLGESLEVIGDEAFAFFSDEYNSGKLTSLTVPNSVKTIGKSAFAGYPLESLTLGESLEVIGDKAFFYSDYFSGKLTSLTIPKSVKRIDKDAFSENHELQSVAYLGYNDPSSAYEVFSDCPKLRRVCVPLEYTSDTFCNITVVKARSPLSTCGITKY